jgi:hypothetical protein
LVGRTSTLSGLTMATPCGVAATASQQAATQWLDLHHFLGHYQVKQLWRTRSSPPQCADLQIQVRADLLNDRRLQGRGVDLELGWRATVAGARFWPLPVDWSQSECGKTAQTTDDRETRGTASSPPARPQPRLR